MSGFNPFGGSGPQGQQGTIDPAALKLNSVIRTWWKFILIGIAAIIILFSSLYILDSGTEAVITRFGEYVRTEKTPGLMLKLPFIEKKYVVDVSNVRREEFGYRSSPNGTNTDVLDESRMLTSDENLVIADWTIQFRISASYDFLFNVSDPVATFRIAAESSYRRVVASHTLDDILTNQKDAIQREVMADLQEISNKYELGITITGVQLQDAMPPEEVKDAFLEVTSAKEDKNAKINDAHKYENEKLPAARGEAAKLVNNAEGYKQSRINEAEGLTARFKLIAAEYNSSPKIMRTRLYLEMLKQVLPTLKEIYIVDSKGNTLNFLPLGSTGSLTSQGTNSGGKTNE